MFQDTYEKVVRFASDGELADELSRAREEYVERTGSLFETDTDYELRIATFLEWYVYDRPLSCKPNKTPVELYLDTVAASLPETEVNCIRGFTRTILSLFEFKKAKGDTLQMVDILSNAHHKVFDGRRPAGLESGDIIEARLVPVEEKLLFSEAFTFHPRKARKVILKAAKAYRKNGEDGRRIDLVHRVAFLTNRCSRYKHVDPGKIFADLEPG
jgi:hypothetical protein